MNLNMHTNGPVRPKLTLPFGRTRRGPAEAPPAGTLPKRELRRIVHEMLD